MPDQPNKPSKTSAEDEWPSPEDLKPGRKDEKEKDRAEEKEKKADPLKYHR